jgi:uncharacterized protein (DUF488 family)
MAAAAPPAVYTIGHSTRSLQELIGLLAAHGIRLLADIRTVPRSRHNPQFNRDTLPAALAEAGIAYVHLARLGGLRGKSLGDASPNTAWVHPSFRNFADYMLTAEFEAGLQELLAEAGRAPTAVMCAEAVPWRCHRRLVADALVARGIPVRHIMTPARADPHALTRFARVADGRVTYPAAPPEG